jgi:acyl-CoA reductase-like NAD-dependent aldehyde dehydrogenase
MTLDGPSRLFVGGEWRDATTRVDVVSPHTGTVIAQAPGASPADVDDAVAAARRAFDDGPWPRLDPAERIVVMRRLAELYGEGKKELATTITAEMGAPISFAKRAQVGLPLFMMQALCGVAEAHEWTERRHGAYGADVLVHKQPMGVVAAVVPWNMPQFLIVTKLIPALLAGCAVVVKPAPETPFDALLLAEMIEAAGVPAGVVSVLPGGRDVGEHLVGHPGVDKVSFTGSTGAGRHVAQVCAANLTPVTLELGGKSAAIVLDDADPAEVATGIRMASLSNSGQVCNALSRVVVPQARADEFAEALAALTGSLTVGDPMDAETEIGPLVSQRQQRRVQEYIDEGSAAGARLVTGGPGMPEGVDSGWYVRPTVFTDVDNTMRIAREEIFGPVLSVIPYADEEEAIRIANDSDYGLAGSVWTQDTDHGVDVARRIRTGTFGVNQGYTMDPVAPFGGVKGSGYGRELGREGLDAYLDVTSIAVAGG